MCLLVFAGNSALHYVVESKDRESMARYMLAYGPNLNIINKNDLTPLGVAIDRGISFNL